MMQTNSCTARDVLVDAWNLRRRRRCCRLPAPSALCSQAGLARIDRSCRSALVSSAKAGLVWNDSPAWKEHAILRTLGPGQARLDRREIKRQQFGIFGFRSLLRRETVPARGISFDQRNLLLGAPGEPQILQTSPYRSEKSRRSHRTRETCSHRRAIRKGKSCSPGPKYSTNFPTTPCLRNISVTVRTRSVAVAPSRKLPGQLHTHHLRNQHRDRLTQHCRLRLNSPTPHPKTPNPLIIVE